MTLSWQQQRSHFGSLKTTDVVLNVLIHFRQLFWCLQMNVLAFDLFILWFTLHMATRFFFQYINILLLPSLKTFYHFQFLWDKLLAGSPTFPATWLQLNFSSSTLTLLPFWGESSVDTFNIPFFCHKILTDLTVHPRKMREFENQQIRKRYIPMSCMRKCL